MVENAMTQKHGWSYSDKPGRVALATTGMVISVLAAVMLYSHGFTGGSCALLLTGMLAAWFFIRMLQGTTVEVDLDKGMVNKKEKTWFSEKVSTCPLRDFSAVTMIRQDALVEEGYGVIQYVVTLEGSGTSLDVYSTEDEQQGRMIQHMLAQYLSLPRDRLQGCGADVAPTGSDT